MNPAPPQPAPDGSYVVVAFYPRQDDPATGTIRVQWPDEMPARQAMAILAAATEQVRGAVRTQASGIVLPELPLFSCDGEQIGRFQP